MTKKSENAQEKTTQSKGTTLLSLFFISKMMHSTRLEMFPPHCKRKTALDTTLSGIPYKQATTTRLWIKFTSLVQRITRTISYIKRIPHVRLFIKTIAKTKISFYESEYYLYAEKKKYIHGKLDIFNWSLWKVYTVKQISRLSISYILH